MYANIKLLCRKYGDVQERERQTDRERDKAGRGVETRRGGVGRRERVKRGKRRDKESARCRQAGNY